MSQDKYIYLIYQQLQGLLTPSEEQDLEAWLKNSPENEKIRVEIVQSMRLLDDFEPDFPIDLEGDYATISQQLDLQEPASKDAKQVSISSRRQWLAIAAAIALLLVAGFLFRNQSPPELEWLVLESTSEHKAQITLSDGTIVHLNKNSRLDYPKDFLGKNRPVKLTGEGFFFVKRNTNQPFQVSSAGTMVEVLGTEFNVRAYADEASTTVTVLSGKVAFNNSESQEGVILTANEEAVFQKSNKTIKKLATPNPNSLSYQSGELVFNNTPLTEIFSTLEKHFDIEISCENQDLKSCKHSMTQQRVELEALLETLKLYYKIEVEALEDGKYLIRGGGC